MISDDSIFGAPFSSNERLRPAPETLQAFFQELSKKREGARAGILEDYRHLLKEAAALLRQGMRFDLRLYVRYGVLNHARFTSEDLLAAVELFIYHLHALQSIDLRHPAESIRNSEEKIASLNPERLNDVIRMARLWEMVQERKQLLSLLNQRGGDLAAELTRIAGYLVEYLAGSATLSGSAAGRLADPSVLDEKARQMIEEVKLYLKDRAKSALSHGRLTPGELAGAKKEFDELADELRDCTRDDATALMESFEAVRSLAKRAAAEIVTLLKSRKGGESPREAAALFGRIEEVLLAFLVGCRFDPGLRETTADDRHQDIVTIKRGEMLDHLFLQVQHERRQYAQDRRTRVDRRKKTDANRVGPERRSGKDRRSPGERRKTRKTTP